jgi:hypothetical protein
MMRLVLILAIALAVDAFFLRIHHASTKTIRRGAPMLYVAATLAPANNTDSAVSGDALTRPTSYQKLHIQVQTKDGRKNAATRKWNDLGILKLMNPKHSSTGFVIKECSIDICIKVVKRACAFSLPRGYKSSKELALSGILKSQNGTECMHN